MISRLAVRTVVSVQVFLALSVLATFSYGAGSADELKFKFDLKLEEIAKMKSDLDEKYERGLDGLIAKAKEDGDLNDVLAAEQEKKTFRSGESEVAPDASGEIGRLRRIYVSNLNRVRREMHRAEIDLYKKYVAALERAKTELTRAGDIAQAKKADGWLEASTKKLEKLKDTDPNWTPIVLEGRFHVDVDDSASIYVNGSKVHGAGINRSRSGVVKIKEGDRLVVSLRNVFAGVRFKMAFATEDRSGVISFRADDFRVYRTPDQRRDFTEEQFEALKEPAHKHESKGADFGFPNRSQQMWGDVQKHSVIACRITREMITQKRER